MRFHARTWPIGCVIAVGLGTTVPSHWWAILTVATGEEGVERQGGRSC
jgi:hypothetical protein